MLSTLKTKSICRNLLLIFSLSIFFSCQKDLSLENGGTVVVTPPDLSTKINSSVSGFVTAENDAAVMGATVQFGTTNITTDKYGYFEAKNVQVVKNAAVVSVNKPGYFKGIKTYMAKEGKAAFFRIKLIPKTTVGNINATAGGTVTLANGLSIKLPAGAVVNVATNTAYTGTVNVAAFWINPEAADLNSIMPGDLRGINTAGSLKLLQTFGMAAVELTGASGELLQIANGKKATLTLSIPSSLAASASVSIPLWYFDEAKGLWKEEGIAVKTGNTYVGDVSHFSIWNTGLPGPYVQFDCTVKDATGNPIPFAYVLITYANNPIGGDCWGYSDITGFVGGPVPANAQLQFRSGIYPCGTSLFLQNFNTTNSNISLGDIVTNLSSATVTGTVTNCSNAPVVNGYIIMHLGVNYSFPISSSGTFSFTTLLCNNPSPAAIVAYDANTLQYSNSYLYNLTTGNNPIGNIAACGNSIQEYVQYSVNGTNYSHTAPPSNIGAYNFQPLTTLIDASNSSPYSAVQIKFTHPNIGPNTTADLTQFHFYPRTDSIVISTPIPVNIIEYGNNPGQYVSGNFSGTLTSFNNPAITYNITCNFRAKR